MKILKKKKLLMVNIHIDKIISSDDALNHKLCKRNLKNYKCGKVKEFLVSLKGDKSKV